MKQEYLKPEIDVIEFDLSNSIAQSGTPNPNTPGGAAYYEET